MIRQGLGAGQRYIESIISSGTTFDPSGGMITIGLDSTHNTQQSEGAIAIGYNAVKGIDEPSITKTQGTDSIAIGHDAATHGQGDFCIAIGPKAGQGRDISDMQKNNTIIINAQIEKLTSAETNSLYIAPIRSSGQVNVLGYNTDTKEITYYTYRPTLIEFTTLDTSVKLLDTRVTTLDTSVKGLDTRVTTLDTSVKLLDTRVTTLDTSVKGLDTSVKLLDTSVKLLDTSVKLLDTRVKKLESSSASVPEFPIILQSLHNHLNPTNRLVTVVARSDNTGTQPYELHLIQYENHITSRNAKILERSIVCNSGDSIAGIGFLKPCSVSDPDITSSYAYNVAIVNGPDETEIVPCYVDLYIKSYDSRGVENGINKLTWCASGEYILQKYKNNGNIYADKGDAYDLLIPLLNPSNHTV